jgi:hypothetical protein
MGWFSDIFAALGWLKENWWLVAAVAVAIITLPYWFTAAVKFFTETKVGMAIGAAAITLGGGFLLLKKDRETQYHRGRADAEREMRIKLTPKAAPPSKKKADDWLTKKWKR